VTAADPPNAFPYFIAIERMVDSAIPIPSGIAVIGLYTVIYCMPCLVLLVVGLISRHKTHAFLGRVITRLGTGVVKRSIPTAVSLMRLGLAVGSAPFWIDLVL